MFLSNFSVQRPQRIVDQNHSLEWLANAHAIAEETAKRNQGLPFAADDRARFRSSIARVLDRCACKSPSIDSRGTVVPEAGMDFSEDSKIYPLHLDPKGALIEVRTDFYSRIVNEYFLSEYRDVTEAPREILHVTCSGYRSPSGAQKLVDAKSWGSSTRVSHAYHMGCYASLPAIRLAAGQLHLPEGMRASNAHVDIVHTELCSLHMDPSDHSIEQLVVQSLFADGFIRYSVSKKAECAALEVIAQHEEIVSDSSKSMSWAPTSHNFHMTLARDVPEKIAARLPSFVRTLFARAGLQADDCVGQTVFAIHPGGPKIIDGVQARLELQPSQTQSSRDILRRYGNMSSATLPHIWESILQSDEIKGGSLVLSLAFGPGLTMCGALLRKVS